MMRQQLRGMAFADSLTDEAHALVQSMREDAEQLLILLRTRKDP